MRIAEVARHGASLSPHEWWLVGRYALELGLVRLALRRWPLVALRRRWRRTTDRGTVAFGDALRQAELIHLAARGAPWGGNCLHRSVTLWHALQRRGTSSELVLGVRPRAAQRPDFHAWVELDGRVVNDHRDLRQRYVVLADDAAGRAASDAIAATSSGRRARSDA